MHDLSTPTYKIMCVYACVHVYALYMCVYVYTCRQRTTISKLQLDIREIDARLHHMIVTRAEEHKSSALETRLQV